jgi:hypothetical protein
MATTRPARAAFAATTRVEQPIRPTPPPTAIVPIVSPPGVPIVPLTDLVLSTMVVIHLWHISELEAELRTTRAVATEEGRLRAEVEESHASQGRKLVRLMDELNKDEVVENVEQAFRDLEDLVVNEETAEQERQRLLCIVGQTTGESVDTFEEAISAMDDYPHTSEDIVSAVSTLAGSPLVDDLEAAREWLVEAARRKDWEDIQRMAAEREKAGLAVPVKALPAVQVKCLPPCPMQVKCLHPCPNKPVTTALVGNVMREVCASCKRKIDERAARREATLPL